MRLGYYSSCFAHFIIFIANYNILMILHALLALVLIYYR
jgi:hypothetical protein